ncbi:putative YAH1-ferredoxin of the mitochondrial matrix [Meira miltonrushii]|uniref:Putative YAH1-ferredoxin of the mitochondrial matrix n=1 Tax=Meira miltonrushii TaxID=1280837 RepID=A0A316VCA1_9BASI|nr:putative YAH1-ferredoxin of the mitochondrial matrix [Meira miltonrushii]PWN35259.1 putative YAH1-ferredoxin of the mitochondrial matrix [Meira miltonrushii]
MLATRVSPYAIGALQNASRSALLTATRQEAKRQIHSTAKPMMNKVWSTTQQSKLASPLQRAAVPHRSFHASARQQHGGIERPEPGKGIKVTFRDSKGQDIRTVEVNAGDDLLSIAHEYDIDLEGACEGSIACSTCHVILDPDVYDKLEEPGDDENDMLDLAFGLTDTSRLGCQVKITKELDGMVAQLPSATRNMYVDGAKGGHGH